MKRKQVALPSIPVKSLRPSGSSYRYYAEASTRLHLQNTALSSVMIATQTGQLDIVKYHIENSYRKYEKQRFGPFRRNLVHLAAVSGNVDLVEYVLEKGLGDLWAVDETGMMPWQLAEGKGREVIRRRMNWEKRKGAVYWFEFCGERMSLGVFRRLCNEFLYNFSE